MAPASRPADVIADRADRLMYASKRAGRNRVTTDAGSLASTAERPSSAPQSLGRGFTQGGGDPIQIATICVGLPSTM